MARPAIRPLAGKRVVVTRASAQAAPLTRALAALGAETLHMAAIRTEPLEDTAPAARALAALRDYHWLVFTSVNGVIHFWEALHHAGMGAAALGGVRVCAIGSATAAAVTVRGGTVQLVPARHLGAAAAQALLEAGVGPGTRVLLPRAAQAHPALPEALRAAGARVDDLAVYRTVAADGAGAQAIRAALGRGEVDAVTFTAGSIARSFVALVGSELGRALSASIGPVTSQAMREAGLRVDVEAEQHTVPGLVGALVGRLGEGQ